MKFWPLMRAHHDLQTHLNRNKDTTGNHSKICITKSSGSTSLVVNIAFLPLISLELAGFSGFCSSAPDFLVFAPLLLIFAGKVFLGFYLSVNMGNLQ